MNNKYNPTSQELLLSVNKNGRPFGIQSIPLLLLFKNGQVVKQVVGAMPLARLEAELAGSF